MVGSPGTEDNKGRVRLFTLNHLSDISNYREIYSPHSQSNSDNIIWR